jgi:nucleoside-diphosphate-sugar epimerase
MADARYGGRTVLVTGATGFIGTHLVRALLGEGAAVHAIRRNATGRTRLPADGIQWHLANLLDPASLRAAVEASRPEIVFHLAAYGTTFRERDPELALRTNVEGSWNLWTALEKVRCRVVHTGSCGEYGQAKGQVTESVLCEPTWFYPATKNASVVLLSTLGRESGREVVTLRPFGPYGSADDPDRVIPHTITELLRGEIVRVTAGEQLRDYAHVDDQVKAFLAAGVTPLPRPGVIYNVGSGQIVTLRQLLETIAAAVGADALERIAFGALPYRDSEVWEMCCDISAARRDLGYAPSVSLEEGIARTVSWFRERASAEAVA